jgi:hypothetical protein
MMNDPIFTTHDYIIGGKLVVGRTTLDESYSQLMHTDHEARMAVKRELVQQMAAYMLENNLVEFTQQDDPLSFRKQIAVRAYIAPNDQVKILRLANKIL